MRTHNPPEHLGDTVHVTWLADNQQAARSRGQDGAAAHAFEEVLMPGLVNDYKEPATSHELVALCGWNRGHWSEPVATPERPKCLVCQTKLADLPNATQADLVQKR